MKYLNVGEGRASELLIGSISVTTPCCGALYPAYEEGRTQTDHNSVGSDYVLTLI